MAANTLLITYGLSELTVEEMMCLVAALTYQITEDLVELEKAIIKRCIDEQEETAKAGG